jgi:hypothetical protein
MTYACHPHSWKDSCRNSTLATKRCSHVLGPSPRRDESLHELVLRQTSWSWKLVSFLLVTQMVRLGWSGRELGARGWLST